MLKVKINNEWTEKDSNFWKSGCFQSYVGQIQDIKWVEDECEHEYNYGWGGESGQYSQCGKCGFVKKYEPKQDESEETAGVDLWLSW